jgi:hypothetical protein
MVRSLIRNGLRGSSRDLERHFVGVEKARDDGRGRAGQVVGAPTCSQDKADWQSATSMSHRPPSAGSRRCPPVEAAESRDRSPKVVVLLTVPGSDASVGARQVGQAEQPGTVTERVEALTVPLSRSHAPASPACTATGEREVSERRLLSFFDEELGRLIGRFLVSATEATLDKHSPASSADARVSGGWRTTANSRWPPD